MVLIKAYIKSIATAFPENSLSNEQLEKEFNGEWTADKIFEKTGIKSRFISSDDECASDIGFRAAQMLFQKPGCGKDEIDFLIFCTQSPDYFLPTTACVLQDRLGLSVNCGALDINLGCSGYIYGLSLGKGLIEAGIVNNVLLITAETYSKHIDPKDRAVRTIFGDGASATLISSIEFERDLIGPFVLCTDGSGADNLIVRSGGFRVPLGETLDKSSERNSEKYLYMNGPEIFNFTIKTVPDTFRKLLEKASLKAEDIDFIVFHQANIFILEHLRKALNINKEKFPYVMEKFGNTVSSTIPIVLEGLMTSGSIAPGSKAMLLGFGVGYSWGATIVEFI